MRVVMVFQPPSTTLPRNATKPDSLGLGSCPEPRRRSWREY